jgi:hypothetical protein
VTFRPNRVFPSNAQRAKSANFYRNLLLSSALLLTATSSFAQPATEADKIRNEVLTAAEQSPLSPKPQADLSTTNGSSGPSASLWEMEVQMAENVFRKRKTRSTKSKLLEAYEKAINNTCLKDVVKNLSYESSQDPTCLSYVTKMMEHYPAHPAALCAKDGIDSVTCIKAYQTQTVNGFDPLTQADRLGLDVDVVKKRLELDSKTWQALDTSLVQTLRSAKVDTNSPELLKTLRKVLAISCRYSGQAYEVDESASGIAPASAGSPAAPSILLDDEKRLKTVSGRLPTKRQGAAMRAAESARRDSPERRAERVERTESRLRETYEKPIEEDISLLVFKRQRYVPSSCLGYISRSQDAGISDWSLTCYKEGFQTPQCVRSLRHEKSKPKTPAKAADGTAVKKPEPQQEGFSTF